VSSVLLARVGALDVGGRLDVGYRLRQPEGIVGGGAVVSAGGLWAAAGVEVRFGLLRRVGRAQRGAGLTVSSRSRAPTRPLTCAKRELGAHHSRRARPPAGSGSRPATRPRSPRQTPLGTDVGGSVASFARRDRSAPALCASSALPSLTRRIKLAHPPGLRVWGERRRRGAECGQDRARPPSARARRRPPSSMAACLPFCSRALG